MTPRLVEIPASDIESLDRIGRLRSRAWRTETAFTGNADVWLDEHDSVAAHFAFVVEDDPVAAARLTVHQSVHDVPHAAIQDHAFRVEPPLPVGYLSRLAVDPEYRRQGLGTRLDEVRIERSIELGCGSLVARPVDDRRVRQLEALGFVIVGRCKAIETGPVRAEGHPVMLKVL
ncbi:MAG: GNAT family N-acetyltransferase [Planctomycetota bacterium]|nr:GNAT family N-acetyltransferase [Planctomycetaceae bacterium]MDQ3330444.1 GNAT family N-acetyltransferase [Planctomycetota bacterium]